MDAAVKAAISAVRLDDTTAQRWFEHLCATHEAEREDWSKFAAKLAEGAGQAGVDTRLVEQFVEFMKDNDSTPMDTMGRVVELSTELPAWYHHVIAEAQPAAQGTATPAATEAAATPEAAGGYDESAWHAFLPEFGARWDGTDASWEQFRTWFVYEAGQRGLSKAADGFVAYVAGTSDKVAAFAQYGVRVGAAAQAGAAAQTGAAGATAQAGAAQGEQQAAAPDTSKFPEVKHGDSGQWVDYLDAMLTRHGY